MLEGQLCVIDSLGQKWALLTVVRVRALTVTMWAGTASCHLAGTIGLIADPAVAIPPSPDSSFQNAAKSRNSSSLFSNNRRFLHLKKKKNPLDSGNNPKLKTVLGFLDSPLDMLLKTQKSHDFPQDSLSA